MSEITRKDDNQLNLFDYTGYSEEFKLKSYERKARIKTNEQIANKAVFDIAQDVKAQYDDMGNYQDWVEWCRLELDYTDESMCNKLKLIGENLQDYNPVKMPKSFNGLLTLARALRDSDEETKEEILTAVESKTEETGKPPTEKEIKEIVNLKKEKADLEAQNQQLLADKEKAEKEAKLAQEGQESLHQELAELKAKKKADKSKLIQERAKLWKLEHEKIPEQLADIEKLKQNIEKLKQNLETEITARTAVLLTTFSAEEKAKLETEYDTKIKEKQAELKAKIDKYDKETEEMKKLKNELAEKEKGLAMKKKEFSDMLEKVKKAHSWIEGLKTFNLELKRNKEQIKNVVIKAKESPELAYLIANMQPEEYNLLCSDAEKEVNTFWELTKQYEEAITDIQFAISQIRSDLLPRTNMTNIVDISAEAV